MDANNSQYFLLRDPADFHNRATRFAWHTRERALTLAQAQTLRLPAVPPADALAAWRAAEPLVLDAFGQIARIADDGLSIQVNAGRGYQALRDGELATVTPPAGHFTDLAVGGDGLLAAAWDDGAGGHGTLVFHLARRWHRQLPLPEPVVRAIVDDDDQIWAVTDAALYLVAGGPLPQPFRSPPAEFGPESANPTPLRVLQRQPLPPESRPLALAVDEEQLYLLAHDGSGGQVIVTRPRVNDPEVTLRSHALAEDVPFVVDLAVLEPGRLAALAPREPGDDAFRNRDCPVLSLDWDPDTGLGRAGLVHVRHPMLSQAQPRFATCADGRVRYQAAAEPRLPHFAPRPRELHALRQPRYPRAAQVTFLEDLDSGRPGTIWHRLYLEGCIPPGCRVRVLAKAYEDPDRHGETPYLEQPPLQWNPAASELPFHTGLVDHRAGESGLFELLLQRPGGRVRRLTGRHLRLRLIVEGDGRRTPAVHAIRVYHPRFSYQEAYLPELFRQEATVDNRPGPANGADVRERLLAAFEGVLTPLEGTVAGTERLVDPDATPAAHLPWLAEVLGRSLPAHWPEQRRRRLLRESGRLQRYRGTLAGVQLALDIATDGAVARGQAVIVENFRLRRTMATILGLDMDDADHPLTLGTGMSGNSIVGDSLILSEEHAREFLALFSPELARSDERAAVEAFFERYAHRVTVLLHGDARRYRDTVDSVLDEELPAHLQPAVFETDHPFVLGLAPLLAVDTFLEIRPDPRRAVLGDTYLGFEGLLRNPAALSPEDANARGGGPAS